MTHYAERTERIRAVVPDIESLRAAVARAGFGDHPSAAAWGLCLEIISDTIDHARGVSDFRADLSACHSETLRYQLKRAGVYGNGETETPAAAFVVSVRFSVPASAEISDCDAAADAVFTYLRTTAGAPDPGQASPAPWPWFVGSVDSEGGRR